MADVEFIDNRVVVNRAIEDAVGAFLLEASAEIVSTAVRTSPVDTGQLKGSWKANVNESASEATIGSDLENAIWNEYGTGEYAAKGDGRKGYWVFVKGSGGGGKGKKGKSYTLDQAKWIVERMREEGLDAYYTKGKRPKRTLQNAVESNKSKLEARAAQILKERLT